MPGERVCVSQEVALSSIVLKTFLFGLGKKVSDHLKEPRRIHRILQHDAGAHSRAQFKAAGPLRQQQQRHYGIYRQ